MDAYVSDLYAKRTEDLGEDITHRLATQIMLRVIDTRWMAYLQEMDYLKTGIGLRGFGQRDPLVEYKQEAYAAFGQLVDTMYEDFLRTLLRLLVAVQKPPQHGSGCRCHAGSLRARWGQLLRPCRGRWCRGDQGLRVLSGPCQRASHAGRACGASRGERALAQGLRGKAPHLSQGR